MATDPKSPGATLNMPQTAFPMRGDLPRREPAFLRYWEENAIYSKRLEKNASSGKKFVLPDGPPYANNHIHHGHILNKILKDMVVKFWGMKGYYTKFVPGWDCHGLPIERAASQEIKGLSQKTPVELRAACRGYAQKWIDIQREEFKRVGVLALWDKPYRTMDFSYEGRIARLFAAFVRAGLIYHGQKPVHWCPVDATALAEAEIEYEEKKSPSIYVKFPLLDEERGRFLQKFQVEDSGAKISILIWTTTPWTLPANLAVSAHPDFEYVLVTPKDAPLSELWLVAEGRLAALEGEVYPAGLTVVGQKVPGKELEKIMLRHPFLVRDVPIIVGSHVTLEAGTGLVHTAPGHGHEDFYVGQKYNLGVLCPVDARGRFTVEAGKYAGKKVEEANPEIIADLEAKGALLSAGTIIHKYAHCWRCKNPVLYRTTPQWFASLDNPLAGKGENALSLRERALQEIDQVRWIPPWGRERIFSMIENRPDWCLSRQRLWGVPIVAFYCEGCEAVLLDPEIIEKVADRFSEEGCDSWWTEPASAFLPPGQKCASCQGTSFRKETDILDVWFDSGAYWYAEGERDPGLGMPADLYLEGSDQHRGWFHSSLLTSVAVREKAPYRQVLTHGFVCDENGKKYSKSSKNYEPPEKIIQKYGAEIFRIWASAEDFRDDMRFSPKILEKFVDAYKKIRNTYKHMLGCLADPQRGACFDPRTDKVNPKDLWQVDRWMLDRLGRYLEAVEEAYTSYQFHKVFYETVNFFTVDLSARYLDITRDRLYTYATTDEARKSVQTVLYEVVVRTAAALAPILSFTAEDIWEHLWGEVFAPLGARGEVNDLDIPGSVHLMDFPKADPSWALSAPERMRFEKLFMIRDQVNSALEAWRKVLLQQNAPKGSGSSLAAQITLFAPEGSPERHALLQSGVDLEEFFIVSRVSFSDAAEGEGWIKNSESPLAVKVSPASGQKCPRCWRFTEDVKARPGLVPNQRDFPKAAQEGEISFEVCDRCAEELS